MFLTEIKLISLQLVPFSHSTISTMIKLLCLNSIFCWSFTDYLW